MRRSVLITTLILPMLASTILHAHAQYTPYDLGIGVAYDINNAGTVVGSTVLTGGSVYGSFFRYSGGLRTVLGSGAAYGVDSAGNIVGTWSDYAFSYNSGVTSASYLGTLGGLWAGAVAINDAGTIVGTSESFTYPFLSQTPHAFSYSSGVMTDLGTLGGSESAAFAINTIGTIVGLSDTTGAVRHAFSYSNGHMTDLGLSGGAYAINDAGIIVGGNGHAFSYLNGNTTDLDTLGGATSVAYGINNAGTIVGQSDTSGGAKHAFIYNGGVMTDLQPWLSSIGLTGTSSAYAINDNGDIVGYGTTVGGSAHAFLLAVPEPNAIAILGLGFLGLSSLRRAQSRLLSVRSAMGERKSSAK